MTADDFDRLLAWFHPEREQAADRYEIARLKLIEWFRRQGSAAGEDLTDIVIDRVAKRLTQGEAIRGTGYFLGVAKNVLLESRSRSMTTLSAVSSERERADSGDPEQLLADAEDAATHRLRVECMVRCLRELPLDDRRLVREYYQQDARGRRAGIARRLGISTAGLYTRMHRLSRRLAARFEETVPATTLVKEVALRSHKK